MTQKEKNLLFKDLCSRLPYGVKVKVKHNDVVWKLLAIYTNGTIYTTRDVGYPIETYFEDCKPYLFPLSSMTEKQKEEWKSLLIREAYGTSDNVCTLQDFYCKYQLDNNGLIPIKLAEDASNKNIY